MMLMSLYKNGFTIKSKSCSELINYEIGTLKIFLAL